MNERTTAGEKKRCSGGVALDPLGPFFLAGPLHGLALCLLAKAGRPEAVLADLGLSFCVSIFPKPTAHTIRVSLAPRLFEALEDVGPLGLKGGRIFSALALL
jgi:hypothetical protein